MSASGHERMVYGPTAASEGKRIDLSAGIAWFGDIMSIEGPFVEIGPCSVFGKSAVGVRQYSQRGRVCARPDPAGLEDGGEIVASGERIVPSGRRIREPFFPSRSR